jgi:uncharacterized protein Yka (UPF0111/DUF47 family)
MDSTEAHSIIDRIEEAEVWRGAHLSDLKALVFVIRQLEDQIDSLERRLARCES